MSLIVPPLAQGENSENRVGTDSAFAVFFAEYFPPYMGSDRRIFDIARSISDWRIEFAVTPPLRILGGRQEDALHDYFERHFIDGITEDESGGIHGHYFLLPQWLMRAWEHIPMPLAYLLTIPYLTARATKYLRARKPNVVVVAHPSYLCGIVALVAARLAGIPTLLDYPDAWTPLAVETAMIDAHGAKARALRVIESIAARGADRIVSITHGLVGYIRKLGATQDIDVVPNGADDKRFNAETARSIREELGEPEQASVVLYSGRLESWSGVSKLVEAISRACEKVPGIHFLFVGDGSASSEFKREIEDAGLSGAVTFLGFRPFAQMPNIVASVDLAIVPFPHTPTTEFCSPVKLFEYMMMGKALITTDLPGIRESVGDQHVKFVADLSPDQLSSAIFEVLGDSNLRERLARNSRLHAKENFTYSEIAKQFSASMRQASRAKRCPSSQA